MRPASPIHPGGRFGDLLIEAELGRGAFATVYRARDVLLERVVALKVVHEPDRHTTADASRRMLREARLVGGLTSPHVVTLYRVHPLDGGGLAFELEYVEGGTLEDLLAKTPRPDPGETRRIVTGIVKALAAAHERGVLHRDVKPANVLLGREGAVKLADFGLGRLLGEASLSSQSGPHVEGTPAYMAPEVIEGSPTTPASDLFSVGVVLYRMLAGRLPFTAKSLPQLYVALSECSPPPLPADVPADLAGAAMACLSKDPSQRPASAGALVALLAGVGARPAVGRPALPAEPARRPFLVGREPELQQLERALASAEQGQVGTVLVTGALGLGTSTLLRELGERARARGFLWLETAVTPSGGLKAPFLACLRRALNVDDRATASQVLTQERFGGAAATLRDLLAPEEPPDPRDHERQVWALEQLLERLLREGAVLLTFDDLQWADADDFRLLADLMRALPAGPLLSVYGLHSRDAETSGEVSPQRARFEQDLAQRPGGLVLGLEPLGEDAVFDLLQREAGGSTLDPAAAQAIVEKAGGSPLHALELMRHLRVTGGLVLEGDRLALATERAGEQLPQRLRDVLALRLASLTEDERSLLDVAATDGTQFDGQAVAEALGLPLLRVLQGFQRLQRKHGLVQPGPDGYRFAHALHRDAIYAELAPDLRRELHRMLAEHLERRPDLRSIDPARIGQHWERAGQPERASPYLLRAARAALGRQESLRAVDLAARGGLSPDADSNANLRSQADLAFGLAGACYDLGRRPQARAWVDRIARAAEAESDPVLRRRALVLANDLGYHEQGVRGLDPEALREAAEALPPGHERALACFYLAREAVDARGDLDSGERWLGEADRIAKEMGLKRLHATFTDYEGTLALARGRALAAEAAYAEAARLCRALGRRTDGAISDVNAATSRLWRGALADLAAPLEAAVRTFTLAGFGVRAAHTQVHLACLHYAQGDPERSLELLGQALRTLAQSPAPGTEAYALGELAHLLLVRGQLAEARARIDALLALAERSGLRNARLRALRLKALERALVGDFEAASAQARDALALAGVGVDARIRCETAMRLAEKALLAGLPLDIAAARALLPAPLPADDASAQRASLLVQAAAAQAAPEGGADALDRAAQHLVEAPLGDRRAEARVLAYLLSAQANARRERTERMVEQSVLGQDAARRLGLVWHELALLRCLAPAQVGPEARARREELLAGLRAQAPDPAAARLVDALWGARPS